MTTTVTPAIKVTIARETLLSALSRVALVVPRNANQLPVLACVRIEGVGSNRLRFTATNLDRTVTTEAPADDAGDFPARLVPCHRLMAIVSQMPPSPVLLAPIPKGVRVGGGRARFEIAGFAEDEFPRDEPPEANQLPVAFDAPTLIGALARAATHAANELSRPTVSGVHVAASANEPVTVEATNGHRLAREFIPRTAGPALDFIMPTASIGIIGKLFAESELLSIDMRGMRAIVSDASGDGSLVFESRLIEGPYPDVSRVIDRELPHEATVDRLALLAAVRRIAALSTSESLLVSMTWEAKQVTLRATGDRDAGTGEDVVPCVMTSGAPLKIAFNPKYLIDALTLRTGDVVRVGLKSADTQMSMRDDGQTLVQNLVMPRRDLGVD